MQDFVPLVSATAAVIAVAWFVIEFQFTGLRDKIAAGISTLLKKLLIH